VRIICSYKAYATSRFVRLLNYNLNVIGFDETLSLGAKTKSCTFQHNNHNTILYSQ